MTREEAHEKHRTIGFTTSNKAISLINEIYDDFESQICSNCELGVEVDGGGIECSNSRELFGYDNLVLKSTYGCNNWKKVYKYK